MKKYDEMLAYSQYYILPELNRKYRVNYDGRNRCIINDTIFGKLLYKPAENYIYIYTTMEHISDAEQFMKDNNLIADLGRTNTSDDIEKYMKNLNTRSFKAKSCKIPERRVLKTTKNYRNGSTKRKNK